MTHYAGLPTAVARAYQRGGADAYGKTPERSLSDGPGNPCRHCLRAIPEGAPMLILAHRPFDGLHPYAETGPIFLCADACDAPDGYFPEVLLLSPSYLIKGYTADQRIYYGTGATVPRSALKDEIAQRLADPDVAFVDIRSARNNCWQVRATRD